MIINWVASKAQQFLPLVDVEPDELSINFDFALSAEIMGLLYAQNDECMDAGGRVTQGAVADDCMDGRGASPLTVEVKQYSKRLPRAVASETGPSGKASDATPLRLVLDEHELALA